MRASDRCDTARMDKIVVEVGDHYVGVRSEDGGWLTWYEDPELKIPGEPITIDDRRTTPGQTES